MPTFENFMNPSRMPKMSWTQTLPVWICCPWNLEPSACSENDWLFPILMRSSSKSLLCYLPYLKRSEFYVWNLKKSVVVLTLGNNISLMMTSWLCRGTVSSFFWEYLSPTFASWSAERVARLLSLLISKNMSLRNVLILWRYCAKFYLAIVSWVLTAYDLLSIATKFSITRFVIKRGLQSSSSVNVS